jgi:Vault protein inter-alpha-trypsin domain
LEDGQVIPEVSMTRIYHSFLLLLALPTLGIGYQFATFRSQATQGSAWIGDAPIRAETYRIVVHPNYLDVELTLEFGVSEIEPRQLQEALDTQFQDALEIIGTIILPENSVVVGLLTWYKGRILKGKLKTKDFARQQYEEVVQRNVVIPPPKPRDPVLLEKVGRDRYNISIFPVSWSGTRKVRLRYLIPAGYQDIDFPYAFSNKATVTLDRVAGVQQMELVTSDTIEPIASNLELSSLFYDLGGRSFGHPNSIPTPLSIRPKAIDTSLGTQIISGNFQQPHLAGTMSQVVLRPPPQLYQDTLEWKSSLYRTVATIRSATESCQKPLSIWDRTGPTLDMIRIYSSDPLQPFIGWSLYRNDTLVRTMEEKAVLYHDEDGLSFARAFGDTPFYPMSRTMPASLGISLGFVDSKYALVALEDDFLDAKQEAQYNTQGVPTLSAEDRFPAADENYAIPVDEWLKQRNQSKAAILTTAAYWTTPTKITLPIPVLSESSWPKALRFFVLHGILHLRLDANALNLDKHLVVDLLNMKGELLKRWSKNTLASQEVTWSPKESAQGSGAFLLRLTLGGKILTRTVLIP